MKYHHLTVFLALLASYVGLHYYSASWLARSFSFSPSGARAARITFLLLAFSAPFLMFLRHRFPAPALQPLYSAGYAWMGIILLAGSVFLLSDLLGAGLRHLLSPAGMRMFRSGTTLFLAGAVAYSFYSGTKAPSVKELRLRVPGLQPALEGVKIAQISDVHIDSPAKLKRFAAVIERIEALEPDLVAVTGDLIDPGLTRTEDLAELFRGLKPRLGVFGVMGNHEYYYGYEKSAGLYGDCGISLLRNEVRVTHGIAIVGLGDIMTEGITEKKVGEILSGDRGPGFSIILSHQPLMLELMARDGKLIGFFGHTHRGQIFPFHVFTRFVYKYFYGLYRVGGSFFYVTSGAGTWGPSMRLFAPAEIPLIVLTRE